MQARFDSHHRVYRTYQGGEPLCRISAGLARGETAPDWPLRLAPFQQQPGAI